MTVLSPGKGPHLLIVNVSLCGPETPSLYSPSKIRLAQLSLFPSLPNLSPGELVLSSGRDLVDHGRMAAFLDLAAIIWWGFVAIAGLFAAGLIIINLRAMKKEPPA
jgi:hypothetical protein